MGAEGRLAIPLLRRHLDFLVERFDHFAELEERPEDLGDLFTAAWMRSEMPEVVEKGIGHLTQVSTVVCGVRVPLMMHLEPLAVGCVQRLGAGAAPERVPCREVRCTITVSSQWAHSAHREEIQDQVELMLLKRLQQPHSSKWHPRTRRAHAHVPHRSRGDLPELLELHDKLQAARAVRGAARQSVQDARAGGQGVRET